MSDFLGTPIPQEDKEADQWLTRKQKEEKYKNKFVPLWQQEARDEDSGRRIFKGAFKGGAIWSVGYNGTVGSMAGWAPSTFTSSRDSRGRVTQRPEDFMDEEDKEMLGLGVDLATHNNFDSMDGRQRQQQELLDFSNYATIGAAIPGPMPMDLFVSKAEPIGKRLLRLMGWREGQGIGPRRARGYTEGDEDDPFAAGHLFAPKDVSAETYKHKSNHFGVGYDQYAAAPEFRHKNIMAEKPKPKQIGFGIGALEEDDDYEVYDDHSSRDMYVTEIDTGFEKKQTKALKLAATGHTFIRPSHRNSGILPGFTLSSRPPPPVIIFPAPDVPRDFNPIHIFPNEDILKTPDPKLCEMAMQMPSYMMEQIRRQAVMSAAERGRLLEIASKPAPRTETKRTQEAPPEEKPFKSEPEKQRRYEIWLKVQKGLQAPDAFPTWDEGLTRSESRAENALFTRTWGIFAPLTGSLADKFVEAEVLSFNNDQETSLYQPDDYTKKAAELNMYGAFTRTDEEWHPENLLCRRFNVANPYQGEKKRKEGDDRSAMDEAFKMWEREDEARRLVEKMAEKEGEKETDGKQQQEERRSESEEKVLIDLTQEPERPSIDLFKAIFEDNESESDSGEESSEEIPNVPEKQEKAPITMPTLQPQQPQGPTLPASTEIEPEEDELSVEIIGPAPPENLDTSPPEKSWYSVVNVTSLPSNEELAKSLKRKYDNIKDKKHKSDRKDKARHKDKKHKDKYREKDRHKHKDRRKDKSKDKKHKHKSKKHKY